MVISASDPRIGLTAAILASGLPEPVGPAAVGPSGDGDREIGDLNLAAEREGLRAGTDVATALETCPSLLLLPPDPAGMEAAWEMVLAALEGIGAEIETERPGEAFFDPEPLVGMYGSLAGVLDQVFLAVGGKALVGLGPTRLAAVTAASPTAGQLEAVTEEGLGSHLGSLPVELLRKRLRAVPDDGMFETMERLGIRTLDRLKRLPRDAVSDRFGEAGLEALRIASGIEAPLSPRRPRSEIEVSLELESLGGGERLPAAIELACGSIASRLGRAGLLARSFELTVRLEAGDSLFRKLVPRTPTRSTATVSLLARGAFDRLPSPAEALALKALETTREGPGQPNLFADLSTGRRERIHEAARQAEAAAGEQALFRIVETDPGSRLPERRVLMIPLTGAGP